MAAPGAMASWRVAKMPCRMGFVHGTAQRLVPRVVRAGTLCSETADFGEELQMNLWRSWPLGPGHRPWRRRARRYRRLRAVRRPPGRHSGPGPRRQRSGQGAARQPGRHHRAEPGQQGLPDDERHRHRRRHRPGQADHRQRGSGRRQRPGGVRGSRRRPAKTRATTTVASAERSGRCRDRRPLRRAKTALPPTNQAAAAARRAATASR